jgi:hypothetical protein
LLTYEEDFRSIWIKRRHGIDKMSDKRLKSAKKNPSLPSIFGREVLL